MVSYKIAVDVLLSNKYSQYQPLVQDLASSSVSGVGGTLLHSYKNKKLFLRHQNAHHLNSKLITADPPETDI